MARAVTLEPRNRQPPSHSGEKQSLIEVSYDHQQPGITADVLLSSSKPNNKLCTFQAEYEDLQTAMETVQDLIERQGIPVFNNIKVALACTTKVLKENLSFTFNEENHKESFVY